MDDGVAAVQEALRRRANLGGSSAGIPGGAQSANANRPSNPIANAGMTPNQPVNQGGMPPAPSAENPLAGAQSMLKKARSGEADIILKSMADRLKKLPVEGGSELIMP